MSDDSNLPLGITQENDMWKDAKTKECAVCLGTGKTSVMMLGVKVRIDCMDCEGMEQQKTGDMRTELIKILSGIADEPVKTQVSLEKYVEHVKRESWKEGYESCFKMALKDINQ